MSNQLICKSATSTHGQNKPISKNGRPNLKIEDLQKDVLCTILSKLPLKEAVKTSVLSSKWRRVWMDWPRVTFDGSTFFGAEGSQLTWCIGEFIHSINVCLQNLHGKVVEGLALKFEFDSALVHDLNNWVRFAVLSRTTSLALDLPPSKTIHPDDRYMFPFELFDCQSICRVKFIFLRFVLLKPPFHFTGFPNLRKLHLDFVCVTAKALEDMLSNCCNLEWLSLVRCQLNDKLMVYRPLPQLVYLQIVRCRITQIEFVAANLTTFVYKGDFVPIVLSHASNLENVQICFLKAIYQHALVGLIKGLPNIQNLSFHIYHLSLEIQPLWDIHRKFSQLRHLQLLATIHSEDAGKILNMVSFLSYAPLLQRLDVHFGGSYDLWFSKKGCMRHQHEKCEYSYLKYVYITGYKAARGQGQFILYVAENAPVLEVLSIEITQRINYDFWADYIDGSSFGLASKHAKYYIGPRISPGVKFSVV